MLVRRPMEFYDRDARHNSFNIDGQFSSDVETLAG